MYKKNCQIRGEKNQEHNLPKSERAEISLNIRVIFKLKGTDYFRGFKPGSIFISLGGILKNNKRMVRPLKFKPLTVGCRL